MQSQHGRQLERLGHMETGVMRSYATARCMREPCRGHISTVGGASRTGRSDLPTRGRPVPSRPYHSENCAARRWRAVIGTCMAFLLDPFLPTRRYLCNLGSWLLRSIAELQMHAHYVYPGRPRAWIVLHHDPESRRARNFAVLSLRHGIVKLLLLLSPSSL